MLKSYYNKDVREAGLDEVGRGCLAGPVVAAAVILPMDYTHSFLNDSKQLTRVQREMVQKEIMQEAIAWAIAEFLHTHPTARPKTLFATHYHELNELATTMGRIKNFNVSVKEMANKVIFLRKLIPGGSEHSFGIHVAKMAGMPPKLIGRANEILKKLEIDRTEGQSIKDSIKKVQNQAYQLHMFAVEDPVLLEIRDMLNNLDVNVLTPVEALLKLDEIQRLIKQ